MNLPSWESTFHQPPKFTGPWVMQKCSITHDIYSSRKKLKKKKGVKINVTGIAQCRVNSEHSYKRETPHQYAAPAHNEYTCIPWTQDISKYNLIYRLTKISCTHTPALFS